MNKDSTRKCNHIFVGISMLRHHKWLLLALMVISEVISASSYWVLASIYKSVMDSITTGQIRELYKAMFYILLITTMLCVINPAISNIRDKLIIRNKHHYEEQIIKNILYSRSKQTVNISKEDLLMRMTSDTKVIGDIMETYEQILFDILYFIVSVLGIIGINPILLIIYLPFSFFFVSVGKRRSSIAYEYAQKRRINREKKLQLLLDITRGLETIRSFRLESLMNTKYEKYIRHQETIVKDEMVSSRMLYIIGQATSVLLDLGMLFVGIVLASLRFVSLGEVVALNQYQNGVVNLFANYSNNIQSINSQLIQIEKLASLSSWEVEIQSSNSIQNMSAKLEFVLSDISYCYPGSSSYVINHLSIRFSNNGLYVMDAVSGSGKTTLFKLIMGILEPSSGKMEISNLDITSYSSQERSKLLCWIPQNPRLISGLTIKQNIIGNELAETDNINQALKLLGIQERINSLAKGLETLVVDQGELSIGEIQRVALCRALITNAPIILLDEPTSALDPNTIEKVIEAIKKLSEKKLIIVSSHDRTMLEAADQLMCISTQTP